MRRDEIAYELRQLRDRMNVVVHVAPRMVQLEPIPLDAYLAHQEALKEAIELLEPPSHETVGTVRCSACGGSGRRAPGSTFDCPHCRGTGRTRPVVVKHEWNEVIDLPTIHEEDSDGGEP